jgi:Protein of unknown function (DUF2568)
LRGLTGLQVKSANLAVKFLLEIWAVAGFALWGATAASGAAAVVLAIAAPAAMVAVWGLFAAPRSRRRLAAPARIPLELGVFALAAVALVAAGSTAVAIAFGALAAVNAVLLTAFRQWEQ